MQFEIHQSELNRVLNVVKGIIQEKPYLQIIKNVLIEVSNNMLTVIGSCLESSAISTSKDVKINENGNVLVPGKELISIIENLPSEKVLLKLVDGRLEIKCGKFITKLSIATNINDYPLVHKIEAESQIEFNVSKLIIGIKSTLVSVSDNIGVLSGINIEIDRKTMHLASTDGFRLSRYAIPIKANKQDIQVTVPIKMLTEIVRLADSFKEMAVLSIRDSNLMIESDDFVLITQVLSGKYPDYKSRIPNTDDIFSNIIVDISEIERALKMCQIFSINQNVHIESLSKDDSGKMFDQVIVSSISNEIGENTIELDADVTGIFETNVNSKYLSDAIVNMKEGKLKLSTEGGKSPVLISKVDDSNYYAMIMPFVGIHHG